MQTISTLAAAGGSDPGLQRDVNEDRFHVDLARGLFVVVDGVGGQAAGGKAADVALTMLRTRLERETGPTANRVREAITIANNEIHRTALLRPEWEGMACVLTVAVVAEQRATVGHVGDSRLYKLRGERIEKITRDHSPVGEREDANEISEIDAMRHHRRNEVYRDVGSEPHAQTDPDFIDLQEVPFEPDAALLLCSDGLTDLVESAAINRIVTQLAGRPDAVVKALIDAANDAGGKDNVTVVYVEGELFAESRAHARLLAAAPREPGRGGTPSGPIAGAAPRPRRTKSQMVVEIALVVLLAMVTAAAVVRWAPAWWIPAARHIEPPAAVPEVLTVRPTDSIAEVLSRAQPGSQVVVEPGEYRERLALKDGVRVVSRVPRAAIIRLPGTASEDDPAVVADGISNAEFSGFRIVGDAATPLGTGVLVRGAQLSIADVEITGALTVAIDFNQASGGGVTGSDIHDNPGAALAIRSGASPRIAHNVFARNGLSERTRGALILDADAEPSIAANVFQGVAPRVFEALRGSAGPAVMPGNWFPDSPAGGTAASPPRRGRQSR